MKIGTPEHDEKPFRKLEIVSLICLIAAVFGQVLHFHTVALLGITGFALFTGMAIERHNNMVSRHKEFKMVFPRLR